MDGKLHESSFQISSNRIKSYFLKEVMMISLHEGQSASFSESYMECNFEWEEFLGDFWGDKYLKIKIRKETIEEYFQNKNPYFERMNEDAKKTGCIQGCETCSPHKEEAGPCIWVILEDLEAAYVTLIRALYKGRAVTPKKISLHTILFSLFSCLGSETMSS